jgi:3D (Asp-Asp-Asp) domain-containing protein
VTPTLVGCGLTHEPSGRESPIRLRILICIPLLILSGFVPNGHAGTPLVRDEDYMHIEHRAPAAPVVAAVPVLAPVPAAAEANPLAALARRPQDLHQLLADLEERPTTPTPAWVTAWHGDTPANRPDLALALSRQHPEFYAQWLQTQLPAGSEVHRLWATVTAYCPCEICCTRCTRRTANGRSTDLYPYGLATDWQQLPAGTHLHIPGYLTESAVGGTWEVDDTGGALRRSYQHGIVHIDVRFMQHDWAKRWGTRHMWVYVVDPPRQIAPTPLTPPMSTQTLVARSIGGSR